MKCLKYALPPEFMIMTVLLILVSSILTPIFLKLLYKDKKPPQGGEAVLSEGEPVQADDEIGAYYVSIARGNNPDKPRNLAKSVTVE